MTAEGMPLPRIAWHSTRIPIRPLLYLQAPLLQDLAVTEACLLHGICRPAARRAGGGGGGALDAA